MNFSFNWVKSSYGSQHQLRNLGYDEPTFLLRVFPDELNQLWTYGKSRVIQFLELLAS
jgi:hypothetical protein